jgi:hypothetical protein
LLYTQIHYAEEVRKLYKLRHLLAHRGRPGIHSQLGFQEYNEQLRRIKNSLKHEGVLDRNGRFVENEPNVWLANLPLLASREKTVVLGDRVPYSVFLALALNPTKTPRGLSRKLKIDSHVVSAALRRMLGAGLLMKTGNATVVDKRIADWLLRYIELAKAYAYATGDVSRLFSAIPAYIGGPRAFFDQRYEPGRPIGPARMKIVTYEPFQRVWEEIVRDVRYFSEYPKEVRIEIATHRFDPKWVGPLPYENRPRLERTTA